MNLNHHLPTSEYEDPTIAAKMQMLRILQESTLSEDYPVQSLPYTYGAAETTADISAATLAYQIVTEWRRQQLQQQQQLDLQWKVLEQNFLTLYAQLLPRESERLAGPQQLHQTLPNQDLNLSNLLPSFLLQDFDFSEASSFGASHTRGPLSSAAASSSTNLESRQLPTRPANLFEALCSGEAQSTHDVGSSWGHPNRRGPHEPPGLGPTASPELASGAPTLLARSNRRKVLGPRPDLSECLTDAADNLDQVRCPQSLSHRGHPPSQKQQTQQQQHHHHHHPQPFASSSASASAYLAAAAAEPWRPRQRLGRTPEEEVHPAEQEGFEPPFHLQAMKEASQQTPSPAGTQPSSRSRGGSSTTVGDTADSDDTLVCAPKAKKQNRSSKLKCDIILKVTVEEAQEFQLVPRLIGSNGRNMKNIVENYGARIRIRGRGSGYYETKGMHEADIPLQMVYRAEDKANFEAGLVVITEQLEAMGQRFARFCQSRNTAPPDPFYEVRR